MANAHQETLVDFKAVQFGSVLGMVQNIGSTPILFTNSQASSLFGGACLVVRPLSPNNTNGLRFVSLIYEVNI